MNSNKVKLGIAPINWTNDDMPELGAECSFEQCIQEMVEAGYSGCEVGTKYPADRVLLKEALDRVGLTICNQWLSTFFLSKPVEYNIRMLREQCDFLRYMGAGIIGVSEQTGSIQGKINVPLFSGEKPVIRYDTDWKKLCAGLNEAGKVAAEDYGIKLCFHHHLGTVVESCQEVNRLLEGTDASYVSLLYDTGHFYAAKEDPYTAIDRYCSRVGHVHLKDVRQSVLNTVNDEKLSFLDGVKCGLFTVPGDGSIEFEPIFERLEESEYTGWMVVEAEQDPAKANPLKYAKMGHEYICSAVNF